MQPIPRSTSTHGAKPSTARRPGAVYGKSFDKYGVVEVEELWVAAEVKQQVKEQKGGAVRRFVERIWEIKRRMVSGTKKKAKEIEGTYVKVS
jgi:hypothetical protein